MKVFLVFIASLFLLVACHTYSEQDKSNFDKEIQSYLKKKGLKLDKTSSGLYRNIKSKNKGKLIQYTDSVSISYKGKLLNGKIIDNQKLPITFAIKDIIAGWKEVLLSARKNDEIVMVIPPHLGYGDRVLTDIPVNSILYFEMKVVDVK